MKTKVLPNNTNITNHFFLLMIVPLLIGLMISLTNFAHAEWDTKDNPSLHNPKSQGWTEIQTRRAPTPFQKVETKPQETVRKISVNIQPIPVGVILG